MPCKKRGLSSTAVGSILNDMASTSSKRVKSSSSIAEVEFFIAEDPLGNIATADREMDGTQSGKESVYYPGFAMVLKFESCETIESLTNKSKVTAACRFADGFDMNE